MADPIVFAGASSAGHSVRRFYELEGSHVERILR